MAEESFVFTSKFCNFQLELQKFQCSKFTNECAIIVQSVQVFKVLGFKMKLREMENHIFGNLTAFPKHKYLHKIWLKLIGFKL